MFMFLLSCQLMRWYVHRCAIYIVYCLCYGSLLLNVAVTYLKQGKRNVTIFVVLQLLREIDHENVVTLANVHINHADMSLYLAFDYAEHDLYVSEFLNVGL